MVMASTDNPVTLIIETGMRMQRLFSKVGSKGIAFHPMTQILKESGIDQRVNNSIGISDSIRFLTVL